VGSPRYLEHHRIFNAAIFPAAAYLEMALAAGADVLKSDCLILEDVVFRQALILPEDEERVVQLVLTPEENRQCSFQIFSLGVNGETSEPSSTLHASGRIQVEDRIPEPPRVDLSALRAQIAEEVPVERFYRELRERGFDFGPSFQAVDKLWRNNGEALGCIRAPKDTGDYKLHPVLLDACAQVSGAVSADLSEQATYIQVGIKRLCLYRPPKNQLWTHVRGHSCEDSGRRTSVADLRLLDETGAVVAELEGQSARCVTREALLGDIGPCALYELEWMPRQAQSHPAEPNAAKTGPGRWLLCADRKGVGRKLAALLNAKGEACILVLPGEAYEPVSKQVYRINPARPEEFKRLLAETVRADHLPLHGVVHLWSLDAPGTETLTLPDLEALSLIGAGSAVHLVQALSQTSFEEQPSLWLVTRGAQPVDRSNVPGLAQAPIWGMGKVIALEHPGIWGGMVDLSPETDEDEATSLLAEIWNPDGEDHIALRNGQRYVARLVCGRTPPPRDVSIHSEGAYLITGGLGAFGLKTARWLAEQGARHLVLLGRRGATSRVAQEEVRQLEREGTRVLVAKADVANEDAMLKIFEALKTSWPPIRGIVHAAGLPGDQTIERMDINAIKMMFGPKVFGTWILEQLTKNMNLDFFVCFSSMVSVWGAKRQAHYAAGNHFLDVFAHYRRGIGLPALTVNWGPLTGGGMLPAELVADLARIGVLTSEMNQAIKTFGYLLGTDTVQTTVAKIDWRPFKEIYSVRKRRLLFERIEVQSDQEARQYSAPQRRILQDLQQAPASERHEILASHIQVSLAQVLGLGPSELPDLRQGFFDLGMDSLTAIELKSRLELSLGTSLPSTLAFDHTTITTLAEYLLNEVLSLGLPGREDAQARQDDDAMAIAAARLEQLSEKEAETLLIQKLDALTSSSGMSGRS
jgi:acyl transferase domain-containing protein/acyl carrier protein